MQQNLSKDPVVPSYQLKNEQEGGGAAAMLRKPTWLLRVLVPGVVVALIIIISFIIANSQPVPQGPAGAGTIEEASYQISGPTEWVKSREWTVYDPEDNHIVALSNRDASFVVEDEPINATLAVAQEDWRARYIFRNTAATGVTELLLDHELDDFLRQWSKALLQSQYEQIEPYVEIVELHSVVLAGEEGAEDSEDDEGAEGQATSTIQLGQSALGSELLAWRAALLSSGYKPMAVDIYVDLSDSAYLGADGFVVRAVWQLDSLLETEPQPTDASTAAASNDAALAGEEPERVSSNSQIVNTSINIKKTPEGYVWLYAPSSLPF